MKKVIEINASQYELLEQLAQKEDTTTQAIAQAAFNAGLLNKALTLPNTATYEFEASHGDPVGAEGEPGVEPEYNR